MRGGGMHGAGFRGSFVTGRIGGFPGPIGRLHGGFGGFRGGFVSHSGFRRGPFFPGYGGFLPGQCAFFGYPGYGYGASFGYSYWPSYNYGPPSYGYYAPPFYPPVTAEREVVPGEEGSEHYWLIAMRDQTILAVTDYWLEDSTLHYVTRQGKKSEASLADIDLDFSKELNQERGLEFQLPRPYHPPRRDAYGRRY